MTEDAKPLSQLKIVAVRNGYIVHPRDRYYRDGDDSDVFVFATVEQMCAWMLGQVWQLSGADRG